MTALRITAANTFSEFKYKIISGLRGFGLNTNICKLVALVIATLVNAPCLSDNLQTGLDAYFPFDGNSNDASGNNHNAVQDGNPTLTTDRFGTANSAYYFNGTTSYMTVAGVPIPTNNAFSWSIWFKPETTKIQKAFMQRIEAIGNNYTSPSLKILADDSLEFYTYTTGGFLNTGANTVSINSWNHFVITSNAAGNRKAYLNGKLVTTSQSPTYGQEFALFVFGRDRRLDEFFKGSLDEIRIYNRELLPTEVSLLYALDTDGDGVLDNQDNCVNIANPSQADCDNDGIGDACELASTSPFPGAVQWTVASGGNGHWYAVLPETHFWADAKIRAEQLGGYLATTTSNEELLFVKTLLPHRRSDGLYGDLFIGANRINNSAPWQWVTGEPFVFTAWIPGQPDNGPESICLEIIGTPESTCCFGGWNDEAFYAWGPGQESIIEWSTGLTTESDCNNNTIPDSCEIANGGDCNNNGLLDACEIANHTATDCNNNGIPDTCDIANNTDGDCDGDGIPNSCEIAAGALDADHNGIPDGCEGDCNVNGQLDYIDIALGAADCDNNGMIDSCEDGSGIYRNSGNLGNIGSGVPRFVTFATLPAAVTSVTLEVSARANLSAINRFLIMKLNGGASTYLFQNTGTDCPSTANTYARTFTASEFNTLTASGSLAVAFTAPGTVNAASCGSNALLEVRLAYEQAFTDCDNDGVRDFCAIDSGAVKDCNRNGIPDSCDIATGFAKDCNGNGIPDSCDIATGFAKDCNGNGIPDSCDIATGFAKDCNGNGIPDSCDIATGFAKDCNGNGVPDNCDITAGTAIDCNSNGIPDSCDIASGRSNDLNGDSRPDECEADCNHNNKPDAWEVATNQTPDCNSNGVPDSCDIESGTARDCNLNGVPDSCDIAAGALDENSDGRIDACNYAVGDFDLNNNIDSADLGFLLIFMGEANPPFGDFDTNGFCDSGDVGYLLLNMGPLE